MPTSTIRRKSHLLSASAVVVITAGLLSACGGSSNHHAKALSDYKTAIAAGADTSKWSGYTFTIGDNGGDGTQALASLSGVFDNAPYKVRFARFAYGPPLIQAAATGALDIGSVGDVPPITGAAKTYGFKIVAVERSLHPDQPAEDILVPKDSKITSLAQLRGKKIAVPQGSSAHGLALLALKSVGLTPDDVTLDFLDPAAGASAFASGKVDAWAIWNPQATLAVSHGARILAKGLPPIDQTSSYYVASSKSLDDPSRRAALTDVLERLAAEFAWGHQHLDQYAQALVTEDGISLTDAKTALQADQNRVTEVLPSDIAAEQALATAFLSAGQISKRVDVASIVQNILPTGFNSATLTVG